jgi:DNA-binding GntR family transcriptional regulator
MSIYLSLGPKLGLEIVAIHPLSAGGAEQSLDLPGQNSTLNTEFSIRNPGRFMIPLTPAPNLTEQVYERILEAIADHTLAPGQRITQNELAERLGVSRQPVSHALLLLHRQGLLAESGRRGFEVTQLDPERIRQLYEVRGAIDALAARMAARRAKTDAARRAHLEAALLAGRTIDKTTPLARLVALDVDFHEAIYRLAGNPVIEEMIAPQWPHMRRSMATVMSELDYRQTVWGEHEEIATQILSGNARAAAAAAETHAQNAGQRTEQRLKTINEAA